MTRRSPTSTTRCSSTRRTPTRSTAAPGSGRRAPDAKYRDGKKAVELAKRACDLTEWKEPGVLDTMAAACAEAGDFDGAVKWQSQAEAIFPAGKEKAEGAARLQLYKARKPYREATP